MAKAYIFDGVAWMLIIMFLRFISPLVFCCISLFPFPFAWVEVLSFAIIVAQVSGQTKHWCSVLIFTCCRARWSFTSRLYNFSLVTSC